MKIFQRKKTFNKDRNIYLPKNFQKKTYPKRKQKIFNNHKKGKRKNTTTGISKKILYLLFLIFFGAVLYLSVIYINHLRTQNPQTGFESVTIVGFKDIPAYPNSTFIFANSLNQQSVTKFLGEGNSAYRLPFKVSIADVYEFYLEKLPESNWEYIMSVPIGSEDMKSGQYWKKENRGLRIYSKFNDVWYQTISSEEAENGLSEEVKREIERSLLLADNELQDLLPDFPWIIKIPKEYIISYSVSDYKNLYSVSFQKLGTSEKFSLTPIGSVGSKPFDLLLDDYVKLVNEKEKIELGVQNTVVIATSTGSGVRGSIGDEQGLREVAVIPNPYNNTAYVLDSSIYKNEFFDYILSNLTPQDKTKY